MSVAKNLPRPVGPPFALVLWIKRFKRFDCASDDTRLELDVRNHVSSDYVHYGSHPMRSDQNELMALLCATTFRPITYITDNIRCDPIKTSSWRCGKNISTISPPPLLRGFRHNNDYCTVLPAFDWMTSVLEVRPSWLSKRFARAI